MVPLESPGNVPGVNPVVDPAAAQATGPQDPSKITIRTEADLRAQAPQLWEAMLRSWLGSFFAAQNRSLDRTKSNLRSSQ